MRSKPWLRATALCALLAGLLCGCRTAERAPTTPLRVVVMDPLARELSCECVAGYAQRSYPALAEFLQTRLRRPVELRFAEVLSSPRAAEPGEIDLVVGKFSVVRFDAARLGLRVRTLAMLTGQAGSVTQKGLFVVRKADPARTVEDLKKHRILFGPEDAQEKRAAAVAALEALAVPVPEPIRCSTGCSTAAVAVLEREADAAVISSYAIRLLEGCGAIDKGTLRVVGNTDPVPFVTVFATDRLRPEAEQTLLDALRDVRRNRGLLTALESRDGFVPLPPAPADGWADWRGPGRAGASPRVPEKLPARKRLLWAHTLTGPGMAGLAVAGGRVVVADKGLEDRRDVFRCLDADTGAELWRLAYLAPGKMDYTNAPRAAPVIHDRLVYLLGAFGHLHCVRLDTGKVVWKRQLVGDFKAELPTWGLCGAPLVVGDKVIVNPGAREASVVALDRRTGKTVWKTPGRPAGYSSFILATLGGVRQIVGYDATSLGGWDPETGKRLWELFPDAEGDYNVPTPIAVDGRLLVSTENNGTRLYGFDAKGRILPKPLARNADLAPDTATPVVTNGLVVGNAGRLLCLDLHGGLRTLWTAEHTDFEDFCTFIAGNGRVLAITHAGRLRLLKPDRKGPAETSALDLFDDLPDGERDVWSHPALVGNRLYVRNLLGVYCFLLE
jgi:outer membrane protein assembly factor BamB